MPEIACVNGAFVPLAEAVVSVEDRGFQFGDGVYEVIATYGGVLYAMEAHLLRLERSLSELRIDCPIRGSNPDGPGINLEKLIVEGMSRSAFDNTHIYVQITRGAAARYHGFPRPAPRPTVVLVFKELVRPPAEKRAKGVSVITTADLRWGRCDIKSIALLANILAKEEAYTAGAFEALLVDGEGYVTEGSSTSSFCVRGGTLYTTPTGPEILPSVTRAVLLQVAARLGMAVVETKVSREEYLAADEVFLAGTTTEVMPVVEIDGQAVGGGVPGPVTARLYEAFSDTVRRATGSGGSDSFNLHDVHHGLEGSLFAF